MPSVDRIDSIYDIPALTAQQKAAADLVNKTIEQIKAARAQSIDFNVNTKTLSDYSAKIEQLDAKLKSMSQASTAAATAQVQFNQALQLSNNSLQQNIELRNRLQNTLNSYKASLKEDFALLKNGTISQAEYRKRVLETTVAIEKYNAKISEVNKEIKKSFPTQKQLEAELKKQKKAADDAGNEYKQLSAAYNEAALRAKNYQLTLGKTHPVSIQATADAQRLGNQLKELDASVGQNQRNVGNYPNVFAKFGKSLSNVLTPLRTAANILPGLGMSGIILGIATGLGKLVTAVMNANKSFNEGREFAKAYGAALKQVNEEVIKSSAADTTKLELYQSILTDLTRSQKERTEALKAYNGIADEANKIETSQLDNLNLINDSISKQITLIEKRTFARAAENILGQRAEALLLAKENARADAETNTELDIQAGRVVILTKQYDSFGKKFVDISEEQQAITKKRIIQDRIDANETVKTKQREFDAAKKALYALLKTEGFVAEEGKKINEKKGKKERDLIEADRKARFEILKAQLELDKEFDLLRANDEKRSYADRLYNLIQYGEDSKRLIEAQAAFDLNNADLTAKERLKIENDKNNALIRLAQEVGAKLKAITAENFKTNTEQLAKEISGAIPKELQKILDDFSKKQKEAIDKAAKDAKELKKLIKDNLVSLASELEGLFFDIFTNQIERQKNAVQDNIDLLEAQKQKDIEVANQTITNAQDRADAIAVIEARAAAKRQQLELRQRQLDQQKARFEKARAVTEIVQSTSLAVVNALTQVKTLGPGAIALAAIIGALGAVQIARVLAQPIPRYAEGTDNHPGGPAIVGDGGKSEAVQLPDGSVYKTPAVDTLVNLPKGSKVFPDYATAIVHNHNAEVIDTRAELKAGFSQVVNAVKRIPQPIIRADRAWTQAMKQGSNFRNFINRSI